MKKAAAIALLLVAVCSTGCHHRYPRMLIDTGAFKSRIEIDIGQPYQYEGFDVENTDIGKDLILHFKAGNEYVE